MFKVELNKVTPANVKTFGRLFEPLQVGIVQRLQRVLDPWRRDAHAALATTHVTLETNHAWLLGTGDVF